MQSYLETCQQRVNTALFEKLPLETAKPYDLHKAMRYAVLNGGKRLRSAFIYAMGEALAVEETILTDISVAIELIHAFSLIHDDLPALDNDDLRRGKPTCHIVFGEATAILAGDALQSLAFEILTNTQLAAPIILDMIRLLAKATGSMGMIGGEALDVSIVNSDVSVEDVEYIYQLKTACLLGVGMDMVGIAANRGDAVLLKNIAKFGENIGISFQIHDDIIGIESTTEALGKKQQADLAANKPVYPVLVGMIEAKKRRDFLHNKALEYLGNLKINAKTLIELCDFVIVRNY